MCDNSSAKTDRTTTLTGFGDLQDTFKTLSGFGSDLMAQGKGIASKAGDLVKSGVKSTDDALKHFTDIMSGNPRAVLSATAPEINATVGQTDQQKKQLQMNGNRTGGTNAQTQDINAKTSGAILDTTNKARADAGGKVAQIGESKTSAGLQELGTGLSAENSGVGATASAGSAAGTLTGDAISSRKDSQAIHDAAVQQWADAISTILFGA